MFVYICFIAEPRVAIGVRHDPVPGARFGRDLQDVERERGGERRGRDGKERSERVVQEGRERAHRLLGPAGRAARVREIHVVWMMTGAPDGRLNSRTARGLGAFRRGSGRARKSRGGGQA